MLTTNLLLRYPEHVGTSLIGKDDIMIMMSSSRDLTCNLRLQLWVEGIFEDLYDKKLQ
jgi:hypothetical protein